MTLNVAALATSTLLLVSTILPGAAGAATFFGPVPYLSGSDVPAGFYTGSGPAFLEDFEDGSLDGGITASTGQTFTGFAIVDSVDADDGAVDGVCVDCTSWRLSPNVTSVVFQLPFLTKAAGLVWTDGLIRPGATDITVVFTAYGAGGILLGSTGPVVVGDGSNAGGVAEDRFFGVNGGAISAIEISTFGAFDMELDHIQYGAPIPLPATLPLYVGALALGGWVLKRRSRA